MYSIIKYVIPNLLSFEKLCSAEATDKPTQYYELSTM